MYRGKYILPSQVPTLGLKLALDSCNHLPLVTHSFDGLTILKLYCFLFLNVLKYMLGLKFFENERFLCFIKNIYVL
jgi:hypothetical protein